MSDAKRNLENGKSINRSAEFYGSYFEPSIDLFHSAIAATMQNPRAADQIIAIGGRYANSIGVASVKL